jgi:hypothetical protein
MGDLSFLNVAFWLADAVTVVLVIAGWLTSLVILATSWFAMPQIGLREFFRFFR